MPKEITMPQLSDTMAEGTVVKWYKKEGDKVRSGEKVADVETDKAVMEMESFDSGTLAAIVVGEGQKVAVGAVLGVLAVGSEDVAQVKASAGKAAPVVATATTHEQMAETEVHEDDAIGHGATRSAATAVPAVDRDNGNARIKITPLAKRLAEQKGVHVGAIQGSGPGGRIVREDVLSHVAESPAKPGAAVTAAELPQRVASGQKEVIPLSKMRLAIARALVASKQNIPHYYESIDADVEELLALRARLNQALEAEKVRLSLADLIAKAVSVALLRHPALNATFNGSEVTRYGDVHLGMAVAVPDGLIVPVLRNIDQMGLKEIRQRSADLIDRARAQRLKQDEMTGATFTVSNLGTYGLREFSAIINPPQVGILAVAAAEKRAVVRDGQIVARSILSLTLSADHRVVDGATAAEFMRTLKSLLEEPGMMLL